MPINIPSKKTLDSVKKSFPLLPQDDYMLEISELTEDVQENYDRTGEEEVVNIIFLVLSLKDGSEVVDVEGKAVKGRKIWFTARPNNIGFMKDGTASKTRALIAYITGQDIFDDMVLDSFQSLKGKNIAAEIIQYEDGKGQKRNKIGRFIAPRVKKKVVDEDGIPILEE